MIRKFFISKQWNERIHDSTPARKISKNTPSLKKELLKPRVYIEEPRRLQVPIIINHYRERKSKRDYVNEYIKRKSLIESPVYQWYKRRRALKSLKLTVDKEKRNLDKEQKRYVKEQAKNRRRQQKEKKEYNRTREKLEEIEAKLEAKGEKKEVSKKVKTLPLQTTEHKYSMKEKAASASPRVVTKHVTVRREKKKYSTRIANCFYRLCCQFYCYLTCFLIIGALIIYFI